MGFARGFGQVHEVILPPGLQLTSHFACLSLPDSSHQVFLSFLPFAVFRHMGLVNPNNNNKANVKDSDSSPDGKPKVHSTATLDTKICLALATFLAQTISAVLATERSNFQTSSFAKSKRNKLVIPKPQSLSIKLSAFKVNMCCISPTGFPSSLCCVAGPFLFSGEEFSQQGRTIHLLPVVVTLFVTTSATCLSCHLSLALQT